MPSDLISIHRTIHVSDMEVVIRDGLVPHLHFPSAKTQLLPERMDALVSLQF